MFRNLFNKKIKINRKRKMGRISKMNQAINPDEIFLDSANIPEFNQHQLEGRIEKPIGTRTIIFLGVAFILIVILFVGKVFSLQISRGEDFASISENNRLRHTLIFADRGNIYDREGIPLAWNEPKTDEYEYSFRKYADNSGLSNVLGYIKYPQKDRAGFYYEEDFIGFHGIELFYDNLIKGNNGLRIVETNALQNVISDNTIQPPVSGEGLYLTIDSRIQEALFRSIKDIVDEVGFSGGAGVMMDVTNGEIVALATYPEFSSNILTEGSNEEVISDWFQDERNPFLNRIIDGLYTPGSIVKPFMALGALQEGVINSTDKIISRGSIEIPNPYNPSNPSIFNDWKAHGPVDVREALAYSSNVYFYEVGGGYKDQKGLGIERIEKYMRLFGFGEGFEEEVFQADTGTIPNPEWKEKNFNGDPWRVGDTYFTSIGQYGFQVTPLQVIRAVSAIANGGTLIEPQILRGQEPKIIREIAGNEIDKNYFDIVKAGMRDGVAFGTAKGLNHPSVEVAAKTGTAELGVSKVKVNSWATGFFPYENPKYAFVVVMEKGSRNNFIGGVAVMRKLIDWMAINTPEYLK